MRKTAGGELVKEAVEEAGPMSRDEIHTKFDQVCADKRISKEDRDRVRMAWSNLRAARDLSEPIAMLAAFRPGQRG